MLLQVKCRIKITSHAHNKRFAHFNRKGHCQKRDFWHSNDLVCAYITGSLTLEDPLIGGTTDIDLIYVHSLETTQRREIVPITDDFHLDIAHFPQSYFSQPRELRTDAWVGSSCAIIRSCCMIQTTGLIMSAPVCLPTFFSQPTSSSGFARLPSLRAGMDEAVPPDSLPSTAKPCASYLQAMKDAANAIACLSFCAAD